MNSKEELRKKLNEGFEHMMKQWMVSTPSQLVQDAEEIAAAIYIHDSLVDEITEMDAIFLLQYEDPLSVMRDKWIEENGAMRVHSDELIHCVESLSCEHQDSAAPERGIFLC